MSRPVLDEVRAAGRVPILVGGTGLYFKALTQGLSNVPPVPAEIRASGARADGAEGPAALHAELARRDPASAALKPGDRTRIARALEVLEATGRPLSRMARRGPAAAARCRRGAVKMFLAPERAGAAPPHRCALRRDACARARSTKCAHLAARKLDPLLPAMKAHGVPWLIRHLDGEISLEEAAEGGKNDTRRYTKRQFTWVRHQLPDWTWMAPEGALAEVLRAFSA